ncbi:MAG: DUF1624 domain-containing protein [Theionarchaea archaeon]|nr:DUF1624 domain-containing protein [Theionarchaea archaeon]
MDAANIKGSMTRIFAIDAVRGWVMIFMALDHAMYFCYIHIFAEGFQSMRPDPLPDVFHYLTRFITHYCAPTFIFLAGFSIILYSMSRRDSLTENQITQKLITRGILLIILQFTIENFCWGYTPGVMMVYFGVLACIGADMIILAYGRRLPVTVLTIVSVLLLTGTPLLLKSFPLTNADSFLEILLQPNSEGWLRVLYPVLPWLGVMGLGCSCGLWVKNRPEKLTRFFLLLGTLMLVLWFLLRLGNSYGNLTMYQGGGLRDFMLMSKYPPSIVFLLWNLGGMSIAIGALSYVGPQVPFKKFWNVVTLFGQTPLFFYVIHLCLYKTLSLIPWGGTLMGGYIAWLVGLVIMYPLCRSYLSLKKKYPESVLQYI